MCQQIALKRGTKGSRGDLQSAFAFIISKADNSVSGSYGFVGFFFFPICFFVFTCMAKCWCC